MAPAAPAPAAPAAAPADAQMPAAGEAPVDGALEQDEGGDESKALCTVFDNGDGTYRLAVGEPGDADAALAEGEEVSPVNEGETFDGPGPLLKAILDLIKNSEGGGTASFQEGFDGEAKAPAPEQKYPS